MIDPQSHDSKSERATAVWTKRDGLQARLIRSHLAVAAVGVGVLCVALGTMLWLRSGALRLAEVHGPMAQSSTLAMAGLQRSLAGLRGWMTIGDEAFRHDRMRAWTEEIEPSLAAMEALSRDWDDPDDKERVHRLREALAALKESQWWIEDVAQTLGNEPARVILLKNIEPIAIVIAPAITALVEMEKRREGGVERKALLGRMADLRYAFAQCQSLLQDLVNKGEAEYRMRLHDCLRIMNQHIHSIAARANVLTSEQYDLLIAVRDEFDGYQMFSDRIMAMPEDRWNVARHMLATQAVPLARQSSELLEGMSQSQLQVMEHEASGLALINNLGTGLLVALLVGMAASATFLSIRSAKRITQPIAALAQATRDLAAGCLREDIPVSTTDELGQLTAAFNEMWGTLRESEQALRESEAKTRAIVDNAADGIITINERGIVETFNNAAEQIFGYAANEVIGENVNVLMPSPQREEHDGYLQSYFDTGVKKVVGIRRELVGRRKDGATFPMDLHVSEVRLGGRRLFTGIVRDISERKRADEALRVRTTAMEAAADAIVITDRNGIIEYVNPAFTAGSGYCPDEVIGRKPSMFKSGKHDQAFYQSMWQTILGGRVWHGEITNRYKNGNLCEEEMTIAPVKDAAGQVIRFIGIKRDITERLRAESELEALNKQMVEISRRAGQAEVATGVLHNVGNVLNSVNVSASVVADKLRKSRVSGLAKAAGLMREHADDLGTFISEDEKGKQLPGYLARLAEHLSEEQAATLEELEALTANIEHINKIIRMQQSYTGVYGTSESVSIYEVLDDALKIDAASFQRHGVEVVLEYNKTPPLLADKHKLLQILVNLVRNAKHSLREAARQDKRLTLRIGPCRAATVRERAQAGNDSRTSDDRLKTGPTPSEHGQVRIEVIDNGVGIAKENLTRIFSYGFTTKKDGHGFGLHSSALAAKEMGGSLTAHSEGPGKGATFTLELPLKDQVGRSKVEGRKVES